MNSKKHTMWVTLVGAGLALAGCGGSTGGAEAEGDLNVTIPSQQEADAAAREEITQKNAQQTLEQLARQVDAELAMEP